MDKMKLATIAIIVVIIGWLVWIIKFDGDGVMHWNSKIKDTINGTVDKHVKVEGEVRGIWLSYIDLTTMLKGKEEREFTENIEDAFENIKSFDFNTVIVQVRPFSDALYKSSYYPWSFICSGTEGQDIGYDPLEIMVKEAHKRGLRIEAWINPYRVRSEASKVEISEENPATKWIREGSDSIINYNGGVYYNPGKEEVRELIVNGVVEIVENYNIDGIHLDDYFYPGTENSIDEVTFSNYLLEGGALSLEDWRRENVNILVRKAYEAIKKADPEVLFGISPQGSMVNNYNQQYIDIEEWVQNKGYIDYICPQIYYGFENQNNDFKGAVEEFNNLVSESSVSLYIGLAAYKVGMEDKWAGSGAKEWINNENILKTQVEASRNYSNCSGVFLYRYDSLFNPSSEVADKVRRELDGLRQAF